MASRPKRYDANLPKNLTYRRYYKSYYWRNPLTGKEIPLGQIARRDAISQAIQANNYIESNFQPVVLLERLQAPAPTPAAKAEVNKEFAQKLLGHKSMKMTNVYLDSRKNEWVEI
ncbi:phage integrase [Yersinia aldovae]|nr:phage integrase [Yersinia aldovae]